MNRNSTYPENYHSLMQALPSGVNSAEVNAEGIESVSISVLNGKVEASSLSNKTALFLRASADKTGYAYTENLNADPALLVSEAVKNAGVSDSGGVDLLNSPTPDFSGYLGEEIGPGPSIEGLKEAAQKLERLTLAADRRVKKVSDCTIRRDVRFSQVINSRGLDVSCRNVVYYAAIRALAEKDGQLYDQASSLTASSLEGLDLEKIAGSAARMAVLKSGSGSVPSGTYDVLLSSLTAYNILVTGWMAFSGLNKLSGSTFLADKLGQKVASSVLSIVDTPFHPACAYRYPFDSEGTKGIETELIREGVLTNFLHNLATARQDGTVSTANAGRYATLAGHIPTRLIVIPSNLYIRPGEKSEKELLEQLEDGLFITYSEDMFHSVNVASGDFSIPCGGAVVRNGEINESVQQLMLSGNLLDLFRQVEAVGCDLWFDEFLRRSYCLGSPSLLVRGMRISGK